VASLVHPQGLGFFRTSQGVAELQGGASLASVVQGLLRDLGEFTASQQSLATKLRLAGDTGIVTQTSMRESIVNKKKVVRYLRTTGVYVRTADGWKLLSFIGHYAPVTGTVRSYQVLDTLDFTRTIGTRWEAGLQAGFFRADEAWNTQVGPLLKVNDHLGAWAVSYRFGSQNEFRVGRVLTF
jgi:hypothetical protein